MLAGLKLYRQKAGEGLPVARAAECHVSQAAFVWPQRSPKHHRLSKQQQPPSLLTVKSQEPGKGRSCGVSRCPGDLRQLAATPTSILYEVKTEEFFSRLPTLFKILGGFVCQHALCFVACLLFLSSVNRRAFMVEGGEETRNIKSTSPCLFLGLQQRPDATTTWREMFLRGKRR